MARHLNGEGFDNRIENLKWGTYSENNRDFFNRFGKYAASKLTDKQVKEISKNYPKKTISTLAKRYKVDRRAIRHVLFGETYKHVSRRIHRRSS